MIVCPVCGRDTSVKETRGTANYIRRRRICDDTRCNTRITTIETAVSGRRHDGDLVIVPRSAIEALMRLLPELADATKDPIE